MCKAQQSVLLYGYSVLLHACTLKARLEATLCEHTYVFLSAVTAGSHYCAICLIHTFLC